MWEMHGFSHQFLIPWENAAKFVFWEKPGISIPVFLPSYGSFCSIKFPSYSILYVNGMLVFPRISRSMGKFNKTHLIRNL